MAPLHAADVCTQLTQPLREGPLESNAAAPSFPSVPPCHVRENYGTHTRCTLLLPVCRDDDYEEDDVVSQLMMKVEEQDNQMRMAAEIGQTLLQKNEHQAEEIAELEEERTRLVRRQQCWR